MSLSYTFNDVSSFHEMLQDGLKITGEDHSDAAQFYSERGFGITGETEEEVDAKLLKDAEFESRRHFNPDETGKARTHTAKDSELNLKIGPLRQRVESALYEEMMMDEGRGLSVSRATWLNEGIRNAKATYIITRITAENNPKDKTKKHPFFDNGPAPIIHQNSNALSLMWTLDGQHVVVMKIKQYGKEREIKLYRSDSILDRATQTDWVESSAFAGIEFPLHQVAKRKDKREKWVFNLLPKMPALVAILSNSKLRARAVEIQDLFRYVYEQHHRTLEEETTVPYIPLSTDDMILYSDEVEGLNYEPDFWEQELKEHRSSMTMTQWSNWITDLVVKTMDPSATGEATHPMRMINGKCWNGWTRQRAPLHKTVKQSLFWLLGSARYQKRGFVSHPALTRLDREVLIECGKNWWKVINDREDALKNAPEASQVAPPEPSAPIQVPEDAVIGIESLMAFMDHSGESEISYAV